MPSRLLPVMLVAILLCCIGAVAGDEADIPAPVSKSLFASDAVLELAMSVDFDALCRPNEVEDCDYTATSLLYRSAEGVEQAIPVEIRVRGGWRARRDHCKVPPLFVRFSAEGTAGTPFAGQKMLPLTTHCSNKRAGVGGSRSEDYEQYVLKEYLGYRLYNKITDRSLRVRLGKINYSNPANSGKSIERYAFFTEHFDDIAARNEAVWSQEKSFNEEKVDLLSWDQVALFNFMIGNTDWSVVRERNILLLVTDDGRQYPVPYDLDMSGLVDPEYGGVSPRLDFRDPRQRYYLGFCHPQVDFPALFEEFTRHKDDMLELVKGVPGIDFATAKTARSYLKKFFRILGSSGKRQQDIVEACHPWPPAPEDHTTPPDPS